MDKAITAQITSQRSFYYPPSFNETKAIEQSYFEHQNETHFALLDFPNEDSKSPIRLAVYNLNQANPLFIVDLPQQLKSHTGVSKIEVLAWDSILVKFYTGKSPLYRQDSTLYLIDFKGNVKSIFDLESLPISTQNHPRHLQKAEEIYFYGSQSMSYKEGKIITPFKRTDIGRPTAGDVQLPVAGIFDLNTNAFLPFEDCGVLDSTFLTQKWASGYEYPCITLSLTQQPLISWGRESTIWEYNSEAKTCQKIELSPSSFLKTAHPLTLDKKGIPTHQDDFEPDAGGYLYLLSDLYRKQYLRVTSLPTSLYGNDNLVISDAKKSVILYDSAFNKLGEGICNLYLPSIPMNVIKEGYAQMDYEKIIGNTKTGKITTDSLFLKILNFTVSDTFKDIEPVVEQKQDIVSYLKKYHSFILQKKKTVVITSFIESTCKNCLKQLLQEIGTAENQKKYPNVYLILIFEREIQPQDYLLATDLTSLNIFSEKEGKHQEYFHQGFNPKAYFFKNGKLTNTTQIMPSNEEEVIESIRAYIK